MGNIQIGNGDVWINGKKIPKCPGIGTSSTIINDKIYIDGYEWTGKCWKKTLKALWYRLF